MTEAERLWLKSRALDGITTPVLISGLNGRIIYANSGFNRLLGYGEHDGLAGRRVGEVCPELGYELVHAIGECQTPEHHRGEMLIYDRVHHPIWVSFHAARVLGGQSDDIRYVTSLSDITYNKLYDSLHRKILEALIQDKPVSGILSLLCSEVEALLRGVNMSILRVDDDGRLRHMAAPSLPDFYCQAIDGAPIGPNVGSCGTAAWRGESVIVNDIQSDPLWDDYRSLVAPMGFTSCWSTPIFAKDGRVCGTFAFYAREALPQTAFMLHMVDICTQLCTLTLEKSDFEDKIQYLAHNDVLTGLSNRAFFQTRLFEEAQRAIRQNTSLALHMIDLDRFKEINDTLGHPVGDEVLRLVAETLKAHSSAGDVIARLGGDEFVVLQVGVRDIGQAERRAQVLVEAIGCEVHERLTEVNVNTGASLGFALFPQDADDTDILIRHADMALYRAKSEGKGVWRVFDPSMAEALQYRRLLETDLRDALNWYTDTLSVVYQPQLRLSDNEIVGFEALLRWKHPHYGDLSPSEFIPIAEEAGLIGELGKWILEEACRTAAGWDKPYSLAVNLSPMQIVDDDLATYIHELLIRTGLSPQRLELEVTESVLIENTDRALHILRRLKGLGVRIAMDDFGTGYSSLSYLQTFPFDKLKIDRSFVAGLDINVQARAIVRAVIGLAQAIGVPVLAEGVETQEQLDLLQEQGCDEIQGYLISRPLKLDALDTWIAEWESGPPARKAARG